MATVDEMKDEFDNEHSDYEVVAQVEDQLISVESVRWDHVNSRAVIELGAFVADAEQ